MNAARRQRRQRDSNDSNDDNSNRDVASRAQERSSCATRAALTLNRRCAVQFSYLLYSILISISIRFVCFSPFPPTRRTAPLSNCDLVTHRAQRLAASSLLLLLLLLVLSSRNSHTHTDTDVAHTAIAAACKINNGSCAFY